MSHLEPILSRDEIEVLLGDGPRGGSLRTRMQAVGVDLLADDRHLRLVIPTLQTGFSRLAESLRRILTSVLRTKVEVTAEEPEILSGRGMTAVANHAACITALRTHTRDGTKGFAVLAIDPTFTFAVIERIFGGHGGKPKLPASRSPTALERRMLVKALAPLFDALNATLEPHGYFTFEVHSVEGRLDLVPGFSPDTTVLHAAFTLDLAGQLASFSLSLPATLLEPLRGHLDTRVPDPRAGALMTQIIREVPVTASVVLGHLNMSLRELMNLRPGAVLTLNRNRADELPVHIEGRPKFAANPISQDGTIAVEITRRLP